MQEEIDGRIQNATHCIYGHIRTPGNAPRLDQNKVWHPTASQRNPEHTYLGFGELRTQDGAQSGRVAGELRTGVDIEFRG